MSLCVVHLSGRLSKDAELTYNSEGKPALKLSVPVDERPDQQGNKGTTWFNCTLFGPRGEKIVEYLKKGTIVSLSGRLGVREYEQGGQKRISHDVVVGEIDFSNFRPEDGVQQQSQSQQAAPQARQRVNTAPAFDDNEIPF